MRGARESESEYILELHTEIYIKYAKVGCDGVLERYIEKSIGEYEFKLFSRTC